MNVFLTAIAGLFKSQANGGHSTKTKAGAAGGVMLAAVSLVQPWEGYRGSTYNDVVGVPTVCYGETDAKTVAEGRTKKFTKDECKALLEKRLPQYAAGMHQCIHRTLPRSVEIALIAATYNIGVGGMCKSSMARKANAGDFKGACDALLMWNKAGGRVVQGLDNRRKDERRVCLEDL